MLQQDQDFFAYETDFAALAPAATATNNIQIEASSDFKWLKSVVHANVANAAQTAANVVQPLCTILITDSGTGRQLMSSAVPIINLFGTAQLPFIMPVARIFRARSSLTITVTNFDAAITYNLRLSLIGAKLTPPAVG